MYLAYLVSDFADAHLRRGVNFLIKLFIGAEFDAYMKDLRTRYDKVGTRKPAASRRRSNEVYALALGKR
jgi:23S rRNA (uridine2552-2'-O)-methyltransferase